MEGACKKAHFLVLPGEKTACAGLAGRPAGRLANPIDVTIFPPPRAFLRCGRSRGLHGRQRSLENHGARVVGHLAKKILRSGRSRDECLLRDRQGEVQSLAQVWIWRHALPRLGQLEVVSLGACMYCGSILVLTCSGAGRGSIAARLGQEGLILKQRIAVADPTRADAHLDWALRASLARPQKVQLLWRWVWLRSQDPRHLPDAV